MLFLVEYKMLWAGKVVKKGIDEVEAHTEIGARAEVKKRLLTLNRFADIEIGEVLSE